MDISILPFIKYTALRLTRSVQVGWKWVHSVTLLLDRVYPTCPLFAFPTRNIQLLPQLIEGGSFPMTSFTMTNLF